MKKNKFDNMVIFIDCIRQPKTNYVALHKDHKKVGLEYMYTCKECNIKKWWQFWK